MTIPSLTDDQKDALQELTNIAIGRAGASLGQMLDSFISLSVPSAQIVTSAEVTDIVPDMLGNVDEIIAVRQSFFNLLQGEAIVIYGPDGCAALADLMGHDDTVDKATEEELLLDVSNLLIGAVLVALGEQLSGEFGYTPPEIITAVQSPADLLETSRLQWTNALLLDVGFSLEARNFGCHMMLLMPEASVGLILTVVDQMLAEL